MYRGVSQVSVKQLGPRGEDLIKSYEGYSSEAYLPTPDDVPTIGWGHTRNVKMGDTCTPEQAEKWFQEDVSGAVSVVNNLAVNLTQSMFDALVSLVFNVGPSVLSLNNLIWVRPFGMRSMVGARMVFRTIMSLVLDSFFGVNRTRKIYSV